MSDLVAIAYPDINRAGQVLDSIKQMINQHLIDIDDAVYVTKAADNKIELHQSINLPGVGAATGAAQGAIFGTLIGLLFLQPLAGAAIGAAVGGGTGFVVGRLSDYGVDDNFVRELGAKMTPNSSALFVLVRRVTPDKVVPELAKYGGTVLQTSLSNDAEQRLQAALSGTATPDQLAASQSQQTSTPTPQP
jgi:uncharacterized membrane protein